MKDRLINVGLALLLVLPATLFAQVETGNEPEQFPQQMSASQLLKACASSTLSRAGSARRNYCNGFISGVEEAVRILQEQHRLTPAVCLPGKTSSRSLSAAFVRYSAGHQKDMNRPAASVVLEALTATWPCEQP